MNNKNFLSIVLSMVLGAFVVTGCAHKEKEGGDIKPDVSYFGFEVTNVTYNSAHIAVTASEELPVDWYWGIAVADMEEAQISADNVAQLVEEEWLFYVDYFETTQEEYPYLDYVRSVMLPAGNSDEYNYVALDSSTTYIVWACGFDAEGNIVSQVESTTFTTSELAFEAVWCTNYGEYYGEGTTNFLIDFYVNYYEIYSFDLIAPGGAVTPVGEYTVGGSNYSVVPGAIEEDEEGSFLIGSYWSFWGEDDYIEDYTFITEGSVNIKRVNAKYVVEVDCVNEYGEPVVFTYEDDFEVEDKTTAYAPAVKGADCGVAAPVRIRRVMNACAERSEPKRLPFKMPM